MGFSLTGFIISLVIVAPNLLLLLVPPRNKPTRIKSAGLFYSICENVGRVGCIAVLILFPSSFEQPVNVWLILAIVAIAFYYLMWIRYMRYGHYFLYLFKSFSFIPLPMPVFLILAFLFLTIWGWSLWLLIFTVIFALGHLVNSWQRYRFTRQL